MHWAIVFHLATLAIMVQGAANLFMMGESENGGTEDGRGRGAPHPFAIPLRGWRDILLRTRREIVEDRVTFTAAAVAFYSLLGFVPLLVATISCYGLFANPDDVRSQIVHLQGLVPGQALELVSAELEGVAREKNTARLTTLLSLALALWGGSKGVDACMVALNIAYEKRDRRRLIKRKAIALALTMGAILGAVLLVGLLVVLPAALALVGLGGWTQALLGWLRWPALFVLATTAFAVLTRFGPYRRAPRWQWLSVGSVAAALIWVGTCALLTSYATTVGDYSKTYGSLGTVVLLIMWFYVSAVVMLLGAELNAAIEHQTALDSTVGEPRPMGERGAHMADTLGEVP